MNFEMLEAFSLNFYNVYIDPLSTKAGSKLSVYLQKTSQP